MEKALNKNKLHVETHVTKRGVATKKWIKNPGGEAWWSKYKSHDLNKYPVGMDKKDVKVNDEGDLDTHWVMTWKDKTGKIQHAYTREFLRRNAVKKWQTAAKFNDKVIESIKTKSRDGLASDDDTMQQASAVIYIIANTGLRVGDDLNFERTGNRGVTTLYKNDVRVEGDTVHFDFKGKSHKQNHAQVKDKLLAQVIKERKKASKNEFLFDVNRKQVETVFKKDFKYSFKLKDMRTYIGCALAKTELYKDYKEVKQELKSAETPNKRKKIVVKKLAETFKNVADKLNNTPSMAKNAYVAPQIIEDYLTRLGVSDELKKGEDEDSEPTMADIFKAFPAPEEEIDISEEDEEICDEYPLPEFLQHIDFNDKVQKAIELAETIGIHQLDEDFVKTHAILTLEAYQSVQNGIIPQTGYWNVMIEKAINSVDLTNLKTVRKLILKGGEPKVATFLVSNIEDLKELKVQS